MSHDISVSDVVLHIDSNTKEPVLGNLSFPMADDTSVSGFGKFVRLDAAQTMVVDYLDGNNDSFNVLNAMRDFLIDSNLDPDFGDEKLIAAINRCILRMHPDNDVVAGTYGKELLLNLLSRSGCEGLRFLFCRFRNKNSIFFYPVNAEGINDSYKNYYEAKSKGLAKLPDTDPGGEVKDEETTRTGLMKIRALAPGTNVFGTDHLRNDISKFLSKEDPGGLVFILSDHDKLEDIL